MVRRDFVRARVGVLQRSNVAAQQHSPFFGYDFGGLYLCVS
jgi:hypothetical protein